MANDFRSARFWASELIEGALFEGAHAVDATLGNGHDALRLCELVGESGHVTGFDIQPEAVSRSQTRLDAAGFHERAHLICAGHERMAEYLAPESMDAVVFNLGWLPGAEHAVTTRTETTLRAVSAALDVLREDGLLTVCVYPGHAEGAREREALLEWAKNLDPTRFDATLKCYLNQPNDPPLLIAIKKNRIKKRKIAEKS